MKNIKFFEEFESSNFNTPEPQEVHEGHEGHELQNYMFFQNLYTLKNAIEELMELDMHKVDQILSDGHGWALDHIATSADDIEEVYHFLSNSVEMGHMEPGHEHSVDHEEEDDDDDENEEGPEAPIQVGIENVEVEDEDEDENDEE